MTRECKRLQYKEQERPGSEGDEADAGQLRLRMVENLCAASGVLRDQTVREALQKVPRHRFLPGVPLEQAYSDVAIKALTGPRDAIPQVLGAGVKTVHDAAVAQ